MIILGIDPGTSSIGYALLETSSNSPHLLKTDLFVIRSLRGEKKLEELHRGLAKLIKDWKPEVMALERLFFAKNQKTALAVAEARGVILLTTALAGLKVYEYTPLEVKKTVSGDGRADKTQIKKIIKLSVRGTKNLQARDDVFDAIAIALTCHFKERNKSF